jgi:hypothetical protein
VSREALTPLLLAGLWAAFGAACLGLLLTGGRGPLLVAKLRLGGLLLGLGAVAMGTRCESEPTCYFCPGCGEDTDTHTDTDTDTDTDSDADSDADTDTAPPADPPTCDNGRDDDHDGWTDAEDPDCVKGEHELGYGTTACNDGQDNDGDLWVDHADRDCDDAWDESE